MSPFRIAAAQVPSVRGEIDTNIATHTAAISSAVEHGVSLLIFPELSLTGYEPDLAATLALTPADERLQPLRKLARTHEIAIVVGASLTSGARRPHLGAMLFNADGVIQTYSKMHLGASERAYFVPGTTPRAVTIQDVTTGLAICADTSEPSHPQSYADIGAHVYAAGVFLNNEWYLTDAPRLERYAIQFGMLALMANHGASVGTEVSVGRSAAWAPGGRLLARTQATESALVVATLSHDTWSAECIGI